MGNDRHIYLIESKFDIDKVKNFFLKNNKFEFGRGINKFRLYPSKDLSSLDINDIESVDTFYRLTGFGNYQNKVQLYVAFNKNEKYIEISFEDFYLDSDNPKSAEDALDLIQYMVNEFSPEKICEGEEYEDAITSEHQNEIRIRLSGGKEKYVLVKKTK